MSKTTTENEYETTIDNVQYNMRVVLENYNNPSNIHNSTELAEVNSLIEELTVAGPDDRQWEIRVSNNWVRYPRSRDNGSLNSEIRLDRTEDDNNDTYIRMLEDLREQLLEEIPE